MPLEQLISFFGWMALINIGVLIFSTFFSIMFRKTAHELHSKLFHVDKKDLDLIYIRHLANYKVLTIIFTIVPYFALRVMELS
ncbi:MAG: DUF6868 family protein [Pseudomonadota bacterium]